VGSAVWEHDFAEDKSAVGAGGVFVDGYGLKHAVRVTTVSLLSG